MKKSTQYLVYKLFHMVKIGNKYHSFDFFNFAICVKRLSRRNPKQKDKKGIDKASQIVFCQMASSFVYVVCMIFKVDMKEAIKTYTNMESLLIPTDQSLGTVALNLPIKKHIIHRKGGKFIYNFAMGKKKYEYSSVVEGGAMTSEEKDCNIASSGQERQEMNYNPTPTSLTIMSVQNYEMKGRMSAQDYDMANALLGLTSPGRSISNPTQYDSKEEETNTIDIVEDEQIKNDDTKNNEIKDSEAKDSKTIDDETIDALVDEHETCLKKVNEETEADTEIKKSIFPGSLHLISK
jgi:hypothetical protein